ncbi:AAA family ATPase, partial [Acinetobacter baumannii]|nr:ATP-binding protein [Acinetobacter baumannii]
DRLNDERRDPTNFEKFLGIDLRQKFQDLNVLSSGEKQILTLISYNSFFDNTIFFIDEPEISLHADWQRILFRILMKQNPTNQFIISTHSPFIYSKYPDKELCIDPKSDRGNEDGSL